MMMKLFARKKNDIYLVAKELYEEAFIDVGLLRREWSLCQENSVRWFGLKEKIERKEKLLAKYKKAV